MRKIIILILIGSLLCGCGTSSKDTEKEVTMIGNMWFRVGYDRYGHPLNYTPIFQRCACLEGLDSVMLWLTLDMESSTKLERKLAVGVLKRWTTENEALASDLSTLENLANGEESQPLVDKIKQLVKESKQGSGDNDVKDLKVYTCLELAKQYYADVQKLVDDGVFQWSENSIVTMATFFATEEIAKYDKTFIDEIDKLLSVDDKIDVFSVYKAIDKWSSIYFEKVSKGKYNVYFELLTPKIKDSKFV